MLPRHFALGAPGKAVLQEALVSHADFVKVMALVLSGVKRDFGCYDDDCPSPRRAAGSAADPPDRHNGRRPAPISFSILPSWGSAAA
jgi:hypothetical protein